MKKGEGASVTGFYSAVASFLVSSQAAVAADAPFKLFPLHSFIQRGLKYFADSRNAI